MKNIKKRSQNLVKKARKITYEMVINNNELFLKAPKEQEVQKGFVKPPRDREGNLLIGNGDPAKK